MKRSGLNSISTFPRIESLDRVTAIKQTLGDFLELGKARLSAMVVMTALTGFVLASSAIPKFGLLFWTVIGTACTALGANSFNEWWEIKRDSLMERTKNRPLPAGRLNLQQALVWSAAISIAGLIVLALNVNLLTCALAAINLFLYVTVYTPMKAHSSLCTLVGAVCGAIPPMMGWAAVTGELGYGAWLLGATLFIWQIPHFLALAWLYRDDYARGGFKMLPLTDKTGTITCQVIVLYSLALLPLGLAYYLGGLTGIIFLIGSLGLGSAFFYQSVRLFFDRTRTNARQVFLASIIYLPLLMGLLIADRAALASHAWYVQSFYPTTVDTHHQSDSPKKVPIYEV